MIRFLQLYYPFVSNLIIVGGAAISTNTYTLHGVLLTVLLPHPLLLILVYVTHCQVEQL